MKPLWSSGSSSRRALRRGDEAVNWSVGAGHGCIGCSESQFWDKYATERPLADSRIKAPAGRNRWIHFMAAIIFDVSSIVVAYLYFFSRFEKAYKKLIPNGENVKEFGDVLVNLMTLNRVKKFDSTHADSFNAVFFFIFHLMLLWMLLTGLQLYVHAFPHGESSIGAW